MKGALIAVLAVAALAMAPKIASAQSVSIACEPSNYCFGDASGVAYDTISWSANTFSTGAIFSANCTNRSVCRFHCPTRPGMINMTVSYSLGGQVVGSASSQVRCTAQDI